MREKLGNHIKEYKKRNKKSECIDVYSVTNSEGFLPSTDYFKKQVFSKDISNYKVVKKGMVAYNPSRINVGSVSNLERQDDVVISPLYVVFETDETLDSAFLTYFLKSKVGVQQIRSLTSGSVRDTLKYSALERILVPNIDIQKQRELVIQLKKIEQLIELKRMKLNELDILTKSRFVEMFGDPLTNSKDLEKIPLGQLSSLITKGASPKWQGIDYVEDETQVLFVTSENVREGFLDLEKRKYLQNEFNEKQKKSILKKGDFLINIVGASIGRAARFDIDVKANINQAVALVRVRAGILNPQYLLIYLNSPKALQMYDSMQVSVARANLSLQNINDLEILLPPMEDQKRFADFVKQVDKLKVEVQKSLYETQVLFDSLMQEYFE